MRAALLLNSSCLNDDLLSVGMKAEFPSLNEDSWTFKGKILLTLVDLTTGDDEATARLLLPFRFHQDRRGLKDAVKWNGWTIHCLLVRKCAVA